MSAGSVLAHLLLTLGSVIVVGRVVGRLLKLAGQPPVIGEILAGILIGPSLLGHVSPTAFHFLLPAAIVPALGAVSQLGVVLYMFVVGLDLDFETLRKEIRATLVTAQASILLPFGLGAALALYLYPHFSTADVPLLHFALFLGIAMSVTAFPVLARILEDMSLTSSSLGVLALTCAAIGDVTAWCLLALVVGIVHASGGSAVMVTVLTAGFVVVMLTSVRAVFARVVEGFRAVPTGFALALALLLTSALTTEVIGVHAIFGAFLAGLIVPHNSGLAEVLKRRFGRPVALALLPAFFAFTGLRTEIGLVSSGYEWLICGVIVVVATVGKFGGAFIGARMSGLDQRRAACLAVLMNTRGLMELIVLNVGLDLGVISPTVFTMLVLMAILTTVATPPALQRLLSAFRLSA